MRRVVVTGMGAITPIGNDVETFWNGLKEKKLGFGPITYFDTTDYKAKLAAEVKDMDANAMRTLGDQLKNKLGSGVIVLAGAAGGKVSLMAMATDDAVKKGAHAGNIIKAAAAVCGGGGGGRPNMAQAGGKDAAKIADALEKAKEIVAEQMK